MRKMIEVSDRTSLHATTIRDGVLEVEEFAKVGFLLHDWQGRHVERAYNRKEKCTECEERWKRKA